LEEQMEESVSRVRASGEDGGRSRGGKNMTHVAALSDDTPTTTLGREFFRLVADQERNGFSKRQRYCAPKG
jgi:hypothetical protein